MNEIEVNRRNFWIILFIYLSVFINSIVFFQDPFEFYFGYLIFLVLLPVFISRYGFNRSLFFIFLTLLVSGAFHIFIGNNTPQQFVKVFTGLALSYFFYHYVILEFDFNVEQLFRWYLKGSYIAAIIGLVQFVSYMIGFEPGYNYAWILNKWGIGRGGNFGIRVNSIFGEPTYLGAVLSAAFFVSVYNVLRKTTFGLTRLQSLVIIVVYLLSFSGLGQLGIFFSLIFIAINFGLVRYLLLSIPVMVLVFNLMYNNVRDFRERYDGLKELFTTGRFVLGKTHGSSYILYNNYRVATENFKRNYLFGTGVGSHPTAFERYSEAGDIKVFGFNLNSADANSMLLRLISETGIFGVSIFMILIFKCFIWRQEHEDSNHWIISNAILIMILLNLFRQGHYFLNGFPFFVMMYYYNWVNYRKLSFQRTTGPPAVKNETQRTDS